MSIFRVFKSIAFATFALALAYLGLNWVSETSSVVDGNYVRTNYLAFSIAVWAWAGLSCWSGALLGLMHTSSKTNAGARDKYLATIEFLVWVWVAFLALHIATVVTVKVHGGFYLLVASYAAAVGLLGLWQSVRPAETFSTEPRDKNQGVLTSGRAC